MNNVTSSFTLTAGSFIKRVWTFDPIQYTWTDLGQILPIGIHGPDLLKVDNKLVLLNAALSGWSYSPAAICMIISIQMNSGPR